METLIIRLHVICIYIANGLSNKMTFDFLPLGHSSNSFNCVPLLSVVKVHAGRRAGKDSEQHKKA